MPGSDICRDSISFIAATRMSTSCRALTASRLAWMPPAAAWAWISLMPSMAFSALDVLVPAATGVPPLAAGDAGGGEGRAGGPPFPCPGLVRFAGFRTGGQAGAGGGEPAGGLPPLAVPGACAVYGLRRSRCATVGLVAG